MKVAEANVVDVKLQEAGVASAKATHTQRGPNWGRFFHRREVLSSLTQRR